MAVSTDLRTSLRWLACAVVVLPLASVFSSGSCHYHGDFCHHHDHHHDHDCDHHHARLSEDLVLREFRHEAGRGPDAHPLARVFDIAGIVFPGPIDPIRVDESELRDFTSRLYDANRSLLGLPQGAGSLVFGDVAVLGDGDSETIEARWFQALDGDAPPGRAAGLLTFVFHPLGDLMEVRNRTWLR